MHKKINRGKLLEGGEWIYGSYVAWGPDNERRHCVVPTEGDISRPLISWIVVPTTLGQCTGRADKDGKPIFQGDILRFVLFDYDDIETQYMGRVDWSDEDAAWVIIVGDSSFQLGMVLGQDDEVTVAGNIHDNPELIERDGQE